MLVVAVEVTCTEANTCFFQYLVVVAACNNKAVFAFEMMTVEIIF
jgi:hypothetical protein